MAKLTPVGVIKNGWLGLVTVGECWTRVLLDYNLHNLDSESVHVLLQEMNKELGEGWETLTCYEAADILGYDLGAYYKYLDDGLEEEANKRKEDEKLSDEVSQYFGVL